MSDQCQWRKLVVEFVRASVLLDPVLHLDLVSLLRKRPTLALEDAPWHALTGLLETARGQRKPTEEQLEMMETTLEEVLLKTRATVPEPSPSPASGQPVPEPVDVTAPGLSRLAQNLKAVGIDVNLIEMATWPEMRQIVAREWLKQGAKPEERPEWLPAPPKKPVDLLGLLRANVAAAKNAKEIEAKLPPPEEKKKRGRPKKEAAAPAQPELFDADENVIPSDGPTY